MRLESSIGIQNLIYLVFNITLTLTYWPEFYFRFCSHLFYISKFLSRININTELYLPHYYLPFLTTIFNKFASDQLINLSQNNFSRKQIIKMGILGFMKFLQAKFPHVIKTIKIQALHQKTLAIDSSNWIYQFLIKTQTIAKGTGNINTPQDSDGNQTGHLIGMLSRVAYCMQNGIKSIWVFDGVPPEEKHAELKRRRNIKEDAQQKMQQAIEQGQPVDLLKMAQRSIHITKAQKEDAQKLIELIGLPVILSPSQAEPQCSQLVKQGLAYGTISEDLDTLAFGCPRMLRNFNKSTSGECIQLEIQQILLQMGITYDQFVDICILCGCDYTSRIKNIGPMKAYDYVKKYGNIDKLLQAIVENQKLWKRHTYEDDFNHFAARKLFKQPEVKNYTKQELKFSKIKQEQLTKFLIDKQFSQTRVGNWFKRIKNTPYYKQIYENN